MASLVLWEVIFGVDFRFFFNGMIHVVTQWLELKNVDCCSKPVALPSKFQGSKFAAQEGRKKRQNKRRCANTEILRCHRVPNPSSLRWRGRDSFLPLKNCWADIKNNFNWQCPRNGPTTGLILWGLKTSAWGDLVRLPWCTVFQDNPVSPEPNSRASPLHKLIALHLDEMINESKESVKRIRVHLVATVPTSNWRVALWKTTALI